MIYQISLNKNIYIIKVPSLHIGGDVGILSLYAADRAKIIDTKQIITSTWKE